MRWILPVVVVMLVFNQHPALYAQISPPSPKSGVIGDAEESEAKTSSKKRNGQTIDELLLFFPAKHPEGDWKPTGLAYEDVSFKASDGTQLHGWYCPVANPTAVVLYLHGNAGNLSHRAAVLRYFRTKLRFTTFIFDYRGYGRSEGVPSVKGVAEDARAAIAVLAQKAGVKENQVVLLGRSLGGAIAINLASTNPPRALVVESSFSSLRDIAAHHYPALAWLVPFKKLDSAGRMTKIKTPLFQSHGDRDRTIPIALGTKLFNSAAGPKRFYTVTNGTHNSPPPAEYYTQLQKFLAGLPVNRAASQ